MNLKNLAALVVLTLFSFYSHAQTIFYLKPLIGGGYTGVFQKNGDNPAISRAGLFAAKAGINIGCSQQALHTEIGFQYMESGYRLNDVSIAISPNKTERGYVSAKFRHIVVPLSFGYAFKAGKVTKLIPFVGIAASYNLNETVHVKTDSRNERETIPATDFYDAYKRVSFWANARLSIAVDMSDRLTLTVDPQFCYMLSNMYDNRGYSTFPYKQHNYAFTTAVGICWWLNHRQKAAETNPPVKM